MRPDSFRRVIGLSVAVTVWFVACTSCLAHTPVSRTVAEQQRAAVRVNRVCVTPEGVSLSMGSGVLIDRRYVLTANHVVECQGAAAITVSLRDGFTMKAVVDRMSAIDDIARLDLRVEIDATPTVIGPRPRLGEQVCVASAVPYRAWRCGLVEDLDDAPGDIDHTGIVEPGNSGSGVYDDRGRLVGITTHFRTCMNGQICGGSATSLGSRRWIAR